MGILPFDKNSFAQFGDSVWNKKNDTMRNIAIYYSTTDVKISTTTKLLSASNFVSGIGGNLGLFVGFSFIHAINFLFKEFENQINQYLTQSSLSQRLGNGFLNLFDFRHKYFYDVKE